MQQFFQTRNPLFDPLQTLWIHLYTTQLALGFLGYVLQLDTRALYPFLQLGRCIVQMAHPQGFDSAALLTLDRFNRRLQSRLNLLRMTELVLLVLQLLQFARLQVRLAQ